METEGQEVPEAPEAAEAPPSASPIDLAAQELGVTPEYLLGAVRLQDENRRVREENERRRREIELDRLRFDQESQQRQRYEPPNYDMVSPELRPVLERFERLEKRWDERDRRETEDRQREERLNQQVTLLDMGYEQVMRGVPTHQKIEPERFFAAMSELYPPVNGSLPEGITPERACHATAMYLGLKTNGAAPPGYAPPRARDPRASITIPSSPTAQQPPGGPMDLDTGPQRPNETLEQYSQRLGRVLKEAGIRGLQDGARVISS